MKIKTNIPKFILLIFVSYNFLFTFYNTTYWVIKCEPCFNTPQEVQKYLDSTVSFLNSFNIDSSFPWNTSKETDSSKINDWLPYNSNIWFDTFYHFRIVFFPKPVRRDLEKIVKLDDLISKKLKTLWDKSKSNIDEKTKNQFKTHLSSIPFIWEVKINDNITYLQMIWVIWKINLTYKNLYMYSIWKYWATSDFVDFIYSLKEDLWNTIEYPQITQKMKSHSEYLKNELKCVLKPEEFTDEIQCPWWDFSEVKNNMTWALDKWDKYKNIQSQNDEQFYRQRSNLMQVDTTPPKQEKIDNEQQRDETIRNYNWPDKFEKYEDWWWTFNVGSLRQDVQSQNENPTEPSDSRLSDPLDKPTTWWNRWDYQDSAWFSSDQETLVKSLTEKMMSSMNAILDGEKSTIWNSSTENSKSVISQKIPDMSRNIHNTMKIIWEKWWSEDSIIKNLWEICEAQWINIKDKKCRY